jgi:hypothetical protein
MNHKAFKNIRKALFFDFSSEEEGLSYIFECLMIHYGE